MYHTNKQTNKKQANKQTKHINKQTNKKYKQTNKQTNKTYKTKKQNKRDHITVCHTYHIYFDFQVKFHQLEKKYDCNFRCFQESIFYMRS